MLETLFQYLQSSDAYLIYFALLMFPFIENFFPPSPSDVVVVIGGALIARGVVSFFPVLLLTAIGSEIGFLVLYYLGIQTDKKLLHAGKLKFINKDALELAENWFRKYGYAIILFNRFISGVRSVIAYFAGVSNLPVKRTVILSSVSSLLWHLLLLLLGIFFGNHIELIDHYMHIYGTLIAIVMGIIITVVVVRYFVTKKAN